MFRGSGVKVFWVMILWMEQGLSMQLLRSRSPENTAHLHKHFHFDYGKLHSISYITDQRYYRWHTANAI